MPTYDDRSLTDDQKANDPVFDPRWNPFACCLEQRGYGVRSSASDQVTQAHMDALLHRVNRDQPDTHANRQVNNGDRLAGLAGAFLDCADQWLRLTTEEVEALGLK